jgi:hypothetical protein
MDYEGNSKPALYRVVTGGEQGDILRRGGKDDVEPVDNAPFAAMTPVIMTHRFFGRSVADLVMDIQRIKTALVRGMLDNLYLHNNPRVEVSEQHKSDQTLDDLLVSRPGGIIRTKAPGGLNWQVVPDITTSIYPALEYLDATREWRTGVTRQGQGIDANALQNQTAEAVNKVFTAAQARIRLIARIFAETGIRDMFLLLHAEIRKHGDVVQTVNLRNKWVPIDPRQWKTRTDMTIDVGLGTGTKQQQLANTMMIAGLQKELLMAGKGHMVSDEKIYNTLKEITKLAGKPDTGTFFDNPEGKQPPPMPPDPKLIEIQMKAQLEEKSDQRKAQIETVQAQADMATQQTKTQADIALADRKAQHEERLAVLQFELDRQRQQDEMAMKREAHQADMEMKRELHQHAIANTRVGMAAKAEQHDQKMNEAQAEPNGNG